MSARFTLDIAKFAGKAKLSMQDKVKDAMLALGRAVVRTTPVDTGRARGNWVLTVDGLSREQTGVLDKVGDKSIARIAAGLEGFKAGVSTEIWLTNTLPYICMLEYGWSKQSPAGIVRLNLLMFKGATVQTLGKEFE